MSNVNSKSTMKHIRFKNDLLNKVNKKVKKGDFSKFVQSAVAEKLGRLEA